MLTTIKEEIVKNKKKELDTLMRHGPDADIHETPGS